VSRRFFDLQSAMEQSIETLIHHGEDVDTGHWQGVSTEGKPDLVTLELMNWDWEAPVVDRSGVIWPISTEAILLQLQHQIKPNLPWADDHFEERVSRVPSNPGLEYQNWPWWQGGWQEAKSMIPSQQEGGEFKFTHTYQERFWPRRAGDETKYAKTNLGIRYHLGDLDDVVNLLRREPHTRQATFPIFFPEDTGAVHGGRIPCTLLYHFLLRESRLHMWYEIRSCDAVRHFRDDVYLAIRLLLWMIQEIHRREGIDDPMEDHVWADVVPGTFFFHAYSFHVHKGDLHLL
jgi:hypothetical protein